MGLSHTLDQGHSFTLIPVPHSHHGHSPLGVVAHIHDLHISLARAHRVDLRTSGSGVGAWAGVAHSEGPLRSRGLGGAQMGAQVRCAKKDSHNRNEMVRRGTKVLDVRWAKGYRDVCGGVGWCAGRRDSAL